MLLALAGVGVLAGCNADSFLDPSVTGYWENTPTTMPILDRIAAIEDKKREFVETSAPVREDLMAQAQSYRLGPSDEIEVQIRNFEQTGFVSQFPRTVDQRGYVSLPRLGQVYVLGMTEVEVTQAVVKAVEEADILKNPPVSVIITAPRQQTFSALGGVRNAGTFFVAKPDYRLLDAMSAAGGFDEGVEKIFVIRQIPLSADATGRTQPPPVVPSTRPETAPVRDPERLIDTIDELTQPKPPGGGLGAFSSGGPDRVASERRTNRYAGNQPEPAPTSGQPEPSRPAPPIDLIDSTQTAAPSTPAQPPQPEATAAPAPSSRPLTPRSKNRWVFINGEWTRDVAASRQVIPSAPDPLAGQSPAHDLMTQRVIEIPVKPLLAGQADYNIVIRPGDVIRVPTPETGVVYIGGQISNPGTFTLPGNGKLTLIRLIDAAGGLSQLAIPERVEITRIVGSNREATIRLNMRAIAERTQPDIVLKADDRINIGTNFWAFPLAIIRNGFRMSYGFGFLVDRNFGNDVFGVPPGTLTNN